MRTRFIVLALLYAISPAERALADDERLLFILRQEQAKQQREEREAREQRRYDEESAGSSRSGGCGVGCALVIGLGALAIYEYAKRQRELREQRAAPRADDGPAGDGGADRGRQADKEADDEIWRVKAVPDPYTRPEYLTVFAEPSIDSPQLARLSPGFSGLRMAGECRAADETRGMCPVVIPVRDRFYRGWIVGDMIEPVSREGAAY